ncbi:MAG: glucose-6-phosphate isomerase [Bacteroidales bacterium]|nr:glucose-6-phosphate isomerase [Bacteroidales bacterium]
MIKIDNSGCRTFANEQQINNYMQKAFAGFDTLEGGQGAGNDFLGWNHLPQTITKEVLDGYKDVVARWQKMDIDTVVVIGIGGSYLGAKAAISALGHNFTAKLANKGMHILFAGSNLSEDYLAELTDVIEDRNTACVVISKSGTTTEPAVAFRVVKQYIEQKYGLAEAAKRIVAVTDRARGALKSLATAQGYTSFVIEDNIGGRYSVLTPVGLLAIALAGYDIDAMVRGAQEAEKVCSERSENNPAIQYAALRNMLYDAGYKTEILVNYNPRLLYVSEWWKQLYGESEGKEGKGIFPASVTNTTDLHSMGQYIQEGERTLFETVLHVERCKREMRIPFDKDNLDNLNYLAGRRVEECNEAAMNATIMAHIDGGVPQIKIGIPCVDEFNLGWLFYFFEKACGISGYVLGINPFNQPGVEAYKKNMFALLGKPGFEELAAELKKRM